MIAQINRFRHDPRMVAPLSLVALLVAGYAVRQALSGPGVPKVEVQEVHPTEEFTVRIPGAEHTASASPARNPYYHPALEGNPEGIRDTISDNDTAAAGPLPTLPLFTTAPPPDGASGRSPSQPAEQHQAPPFPKSPSHDTTIQPPEPQPESTKLPAYRLTAILMGSRPAAILATEDGASLYVSTGEELPSGERIARLTPHYVALEGELCTRLLFLETGGLR